jgi:hypothetical protein
MRIRDGRNSNPGSGMEKFGSGHCLLPTYATLVAWIVLTYLFSLLWENMPLITNYLCILVLQTLLRQETVVTVQGVPLTSYMEGIIGELQLSFAIPGVHSRNS